MEKGLSQADLGSMVGCSNNHMSHVETGQTKVSLTMLLKISQALEKDMNYFLLDAPYVQTERIINLEIAQKLSQCNADTLISLSRIIDVLLDQQNREH